MGKIFCFLLAAVLVTGCTKKTADESSPYGNILQFGTGISISNITDLTGITTTFNPNAIIYFRLESVDNQGSSPIRIQVDKQDGTAYHTFDYPASQGNGHVFLSYFTIADAGSYTVTGIITTGNITVATQSLTIRAGK